MAAFTSCGAEVLPRDPGGRTVLVQHDCRCAVTIAPGSARNREALGVAAFARDPMTTEVTDAAAN